MAIKSKLDAAWGTNEAMDAVFEVRAQAENAYRVLQETVANINEILVDTSFNSVDADIKNEGAQIINALTQAKNMLSTHEDFLNWRQPK